MRATLVKSPAQVELIRTAIAVAEGALGAAVEALRPGVREVELKGVFEERMCRLGTTTPAFEGAFCVIDGDEPIRRSVSNRRMAEGDRVALSAGVLRDGWEGSLARTWPCGEPTTELRDRRSRWDGAWASLVDRCHAGVHAAELDASAPGTSVHGAGLGYEGIDNATPLEPGMVIRLELEAYGILGADMLLIEDDDGEVLSAFPYGAAGE